MLGRRDGRGGRGSVPRKLSRGMEGQLQAHLADGRHADVAQIQWINSLQFHSLLEPTAFRVHGPNLQGMGQLGNPGRPSSRMGEPASGREAGREKDIPAKSRSPEAGHAPTAEGCASPS